jgi:HEAT repeat protein
MIHIFSVLLFLLAIDIHADFSSPNEKIDRINGLMNSVSSSPLSNGKAFRTLMQYTKDANVVVRTGSISALGTVAQTLTPSDAQIAINTLKNGLADPSPSVRRESALALGKYGAAAATASESLLKVAMGEPETDVSLFSIQSLGKIAQHADTVVPALVAIVQSSHNDESKVQWEAIPSVEALASFRNQSTEIVPKLMQFLDSNNFEFLAALVTTISTLDPDNNGLDLPIEKLLAQKNVQWRISALRAVAKLKVSPISNTGRLEELAEKDESPAVQFLAKQILDSCRSNNK